MVGTAFLGVRSLLRIVDPNGHSQIDEMHAMHRRHKTTVEKRADRLKLYQVLDNPSYRNAFMQYEYDFGDCWEHEMTLVSRADHATDFSQYTEGKGHGVAEDVGGTTGWKELKRACRSATPNREQREKTPWFETQASNRDQFRLKNG